MSKTIGTGGTIKSEPGHFIVEEITKSGKILELGKVFTSEELGDTKDDSGKFTRFILQKKNWDTPRALRSIAHASGRGWKSIGYAGMKDRVSVSTQMASIYGISPEDLQRVKIKDILINGAWRSKEGIRVGELNGNHFSILISSVKNAEAVYATIGALSGNMPNYFDAQRFGIRQNNFTVGMHILRGEFKEAVMDFLTNATNERNEDAIEARKRLLDREDFFSAKEYFPRYLRYERQIIDYLARFPDNFANSIRMLPRGISLMFIHSVEDAIFNATLEYALANEFDGIKLWCGENAYGFQDIGSVSYEKNDIPALSLIGYETHDNNISEKEKEMLDILGMSKDLFKIKSIPELGIKGSVRACISKVKDVECAAEKSLVRLSFSLPAGSYATIFIGEITKNKGIEIKDIAPELCM